eukprot:3823968-Prymnesium_polylepis.1
MLIVLCAHFACVRLLSAVVVAQLACAWPCGLSERRRGASTGLARRTRRGQPRVARPRARLCVLFTSCVSCRTSSCMCVV